MARILVIDDEPTILLVLQEILEDEGYMVFTAANGLEGMKVLGEGPPPDVILIDLLMPGMGGREFIRLLRTNDNQSRIPVILITGAIPNTEDFPVEGSYQDVISKPFDILDIIHKVNRLLKVMNPLPAKD
ncbi:MAG TPA: response regulator [Bacillota bacterium]